MQINAALILIITIIGFSMLAIIYFYPSVALGIFFAIPLIKPDIVMRFPFLTGLVGYIFDTSIVVFAILSLIIYLQKAGARVRIFIPKSFWFCWFVLSLLVWMRLPASRDTVTGFQRAMLFSVYNTFVLILGAICGSSVKSASKLFSALIGVGLLCTFGLLIFGSPTAEYEAARMSIAGAQVLALGDSIAYMIIVFLAFWLSKRRYFLRKPAFILIGFALFAILLAGHRGAVLGLMVAFLLMAIAYRKTHGIRTIFSGLILVLVLGVVINYFFTKSAQSRRFEKEQIASAVSGRVSMVKSTLSEWSKSPVFGTGTGDMSFQMTGIAGEKEYPHNIYLEILNELGIVGFIFYMVIFAHAFSVFKPALSYQYNSLVPREFLVIAASGLAYHILFGLKTSTYAGSFMLYFFMGAGISLTRLSRQQESLQFEQLNYEQADSQQDYLEQ